MKNHVFAIVASIALSACASSVLTVEKPYSGAERYSSAELKYDQSSVPVDENNLSYTQRKLDQALFGGKSPIFKRGQGLTVRYRYVGFNEGSRVGRYLLPGIAGGSKIVLEADFVNSEGAVLATVRGEGAVAGGFFGGSNKSGVDKAVSEIADYAARNFR